MTTLHYTSGDTFDAQGNFTAAKAGFNLADVSSVDELNALPNGVQGLVWLDQYHGVNQSFIDALTPFIGNPKVYGFYLVDEPDPTGQWGAQASAADLKAESDWIHSHLPGAKTYITMMNMGSADNPSFANTYTPENTHIDLFGLDYYPVWSDGALDNSNIDKYVAAAVASGISVDKLVPVYQTFGGGNWVTENGSHFVMPTAAQEQQMLDHWAKALPNPAFDYAYAWGSQNGDTALESSPALQQVFLQHNLQHNTSGSTTPVAGTGGSTTPASTGTSTAPADSTTTTVDSSTPVADPSGSTSTAGHTTTPASTTTGTSTAPADSTTTTVDSSTPVADPSGSTSTAGHTTTPVVSSGSITTATDPTAATTTDHSGLWQQNGGLDFSQLLGTKFGGSGWVGHQSASTSYAAPTDVSTSTMADTAWSAIADATHLDFGAKFHQVDTTDHHWWHHG